MDNPLVNTLPSQQPDMGDSSALLSLFSIGKLRQEKGLLAVSFGELRAFGAYQHRTVGGQSSDIPDNSANYPTAVLGSFTWHGLFAQPHRRAALGFSSTFQKL